GEDFGVRARRRAARVAGMAEQVGGAPQQPAAGLALQRLEVVDCLGEVAAMLGDRMRLAHHVDVVEAVERHVEPGEEVERGLALGARGGVIVGAGVPRALEGARAEDVAARPAERVPEAHREADRKSTRLNSSHVKISYAVFCLKKKTNDE